MRSRRLPSARQLCFSWPTGVSNIAVIKEETRHVQRQGTPPPLAPIRLPLPPKELWPRLPGPQQQAVVRLLSDLIHRRLLAPADKEVANDSR